MKPMTIEQEAIMLANKTDTTEDNRWNLYAWQAKWMARQNSIGDPPNAS